ncbi:MAG: Swi5-domain-containing protein [Piptocephalis tieghemiana]|nr:MAG: Swi5-domain-containing protein [Piptocephalis tieghemiana]
MNTPESTPSREGADGRDWHLDTAIHAIHAYITSLPDHGPTAPPLTLDEVVEACHLEPSEGLGALRRLVEDGVLARAKVEGAEERLSWWRIRTSHPLFSNQLVSRPSSVSTTGENTAGPKESFGTPPKEEDRTPGPPNTAEETGLTRLEAQVKEAEEKVHALTQELSMSSEALQQAVRHHVQDLHIYNETKDIAQMLMGKCADMDGMTLREVHVHFGLEDED